ncbi:unnamed protein product [Rotaria sordida]|uniref:Uncharacterized protein n=1 Tax=Rotaria sordida TaxID=392033 RepID=A0A819Q5L3_9BILA|nr:unnamed protein product [Rotaria sordida]CAF4029548.1 unnamed protein product [Rotaria sordida]
MKPFDQTLVKDFFTLFYETTELCLRSNNDLCNLSSNDRSVLFRTGADCITCFGRAFSICQYQLNTCQSFLNMLHTIYGEQSVAVTLNSIKFVDTDIALAKMAGLLLVFSNNTCIFSSTTPLDHVNASVMLQVQNKYAEVTWKYLLYRYGYYHAVQRFMYLIQFLLTLTQTISHLQSIRSHVNDIESIVENTELALILDDIDQINETTDH